MLKSFPISVVVGAALGFLAGSGVGGGSLLMLWLTLIAGIPQEKARMINLLFFILSAGTACLIRTVKKKISVKENIPAMIAGCFTAVIFSWISTKIEIKLIRKILGGLFIVTGIRELFYRPR